jgi:GTP-binding protein Era
MLGTKVFLELFVKVQPGWRERREFIDALDWRRQLEDLARRQARACFINGFGLTEGTYA